MNIQDKAEDISVSASEVKDKWISVFCLKLLRRRCCIKQRSGHLLPCLSWTECYPRAIVCPSIISKTWPDYRKWLVCFDSSQQKICKSVVILQIFEKEFEMQVTVEQHVEQHVQAEPFWNKHFWYKNRANWVGFRSVCPPLGPNSINCSFRDLDQAAISTRGLSFSSIWSLIVLIEAFVLLISSPVHSSRMSLSSMSWSIFSPPLSSRSILCFP